MEPTHASFAELGVDKLYLNGISSMGISKPSAIQASAIPAILNDPCCNVAIQSYTGSGKTLAFLLPTMTRAIRMAEKLYKEGAQEVPLQLLVISPSQELAMQTVRVAQSLLPEQSRKLVQQCIGGANPWRQQESILVNKPLVVVGTPGRVAEFIKTGALKVHPCPILCLDEADQLLAPNFAEDMAHITSHCGKREVAAGRVRQTVIVSATLSVSVLKKTGEWCPDPKFITAGAPAPPSVPQGSISSIKAGAGPSSGPSWGWGAKGWEGRDSTLAPRILGTAGGVEGSEGLVPTLPPGLKHYYIVVPARHKADALRRCIHALDLERVLVFMNFQHRLRDTMYRLEARGMKVGSLHGEMSKMTRANVLNDFRRGRLRALVVSDVVARGLDISGCDAVFNSELPSSASHYAHRAGRTGRMDAPGAVVSIVTGSEAFVIDKLSKRLGVEIQEAHVLGGKLVIGPAPPSLRYDLDEAGNENNEDRGVRSEVKVVATDNKKRAEVKVEDGSLGLKDQLAVKVRSGARAVRRVEERGKAGEEGVKKVQDDGEHDDEEEDEEDVPIDVKGLETKLKREKALANGRVWTQSNPKIGSLVKRDLGRELEDLKAEKQGLKVARFHKRKSEMEPESQ